MRAWPRRRAWIHGAVAIAVAIAGAGAGLVPGWPWWLSALGPALGVAWFLVVMRRFLRRTRIVRTPFPEEWRTQLSRCVAFYRNLDESGRRRFEDDVRFFIAEQRIYGLRGAEVPDRIKLLVAASAAMLTHGLPDWEWPTLRDIVIYPTAFGDDYAIGDGEHILGMVHHQGPIVFSARDLKHGFCKPRDGLNVGLHEMAHVMDFADGRADGVPDGLEWAAAAPWIDVVADRLKRMRTRRGKKPLRAYAGTNEAELFAVAVEAFFEHPERLAARDPELYEMLRDYFKQDPAG